jgi:hypothetical protein
VVIPLPRERFGHLTTPSEAQPILSLIDWDFANARMAGHAAKRLEEMRREREAARRGGEPKREKETVAKAKQDSAGWPTDGQPKQLSPT